MNHTKPGMVFVWFISRRRVINTKINWWKINENSTFCRKFACWIVEQLNLNRLGVSISKQTYFLFESAPAICSTMVTLFSQFFCSRIERTNLLNLLTHRLVLRGIPCTASSQRPYQLQFHKLLYTQEALDTWCFSISHEASAPRGIHFFLLQTEGVKLNISFTEPAASFTSCFSTYVLMKPASGYTSCSK